MKAIYEAEDIENSPATLRLEGGETILLTTAENEIFKKLMGWRGNIDVLIHVDTTVKLTLNAELCINTFRGLTE